MEKDDIIGQAKYLVGMAPMNTISYLACTKPLCHNRPLVLSCRASPRKIGLFYLNQWMDEDMPEKHNTAPHLTLHTALALSDSLDGKRESVAKAVM